MRIPDYPNVHGVKYLNHWTTKTSRVEKAHEDAFDKSWKTPFIKENLKKKRK